MIKVLDHGFVRLVDSMGSDLSVVRAARVSYDAEPRGDGSDEKLIHYLMKNRHTSPFEAVSFTFEVMAPIFIFRQWHRHRTWSFNEVSARYAELPEVYYVPEPADVGIQSASNKQARETEGLTEAEIEERRKQVGDYKVIVEGTFMAYQYLLHAGWPRELARMVLPVSTYSRMFATVDLHNLFHFLGLRLHPHAQREIQAYASALLELIRPVVPTCVAAWERSREPA